MDLGLPISVVFIQETGREIQMGSVVGKRAEWCLYPIQLGNVQFEDKFGFTYFHVTHPHPDNLTELVIRNKMKESQICIQNYKISSSKSRVRQFQ